MHELLRPTRPTQAEAHERCRRYLGSRWKRFPLGYRLLPARQRADLVALCAWHGLVRETVRGAGDVEDLRRALGELTRCVETTYATELDSAMACALAPAVTYHRFSALLFRRPLDEHGNVEHRHTFQTRSDLLQHARSLALGEARMLTRVLALTSEREQAQAESLALGLQLVDWLVHLPRDAARGRLHLAVEDLTRHGVDLLLLLRDGAQVCRQPEQRLRDLLAGQVSWARELLARGWPLCEELTAWRGRELAFVLRWHAAALSAIEVRGYRLAPDPPPAGWMRLLACIVSCAATRGAPRF